MVRHESSYLKTTAGTLECVLLVTGEHRGFVRRRLDQVHLRATRKTPHVDHPFAFNNKRLACGWASDINFATDKGRPRRARPAAHLGVSRSDVRTFPAAHASISDREPSERGKHSASRP